MNVLERKKQKSRSFRDFFVRCRRTYVLNKSVTSLQNIKLCLEYFAEGIIEKLYKKLNRV